MNEDEELEQIIGDDKEKYKDIQFKVQSIYNIAKNMCNIIDNLFQGLDEGKSQMINILNLCN